MRRSSTFDFAIAEREFSECGQALLQRVAGVDFLGFAEDEGLEQLGAGALRHPKIQYLIQQLIHENKVEAQLRRKYGVNYGQCIRKNASGM
jgi:hypothetical protein